ncbi:hypothetical protein LR48_Vigan11g107600 [Vigna angularis]|uniref:Uncharacterized protein n=1 Tax=Phaseolus angularis TaxID=3914 RepID=A0A0L9VSX4_PHAAN|nr:hypothetical protein LR48_Vigan11g107600 [Vigna angularis]
MQKFCGAATVRTERPFILKGGSGGKGRHVPGSGRGRLHVEKVERLPVCRVVQLMGGRSSHFEVLQQLRNTIISFVGGHSTEEWLWGAPFSSFLKRGERLAADLGEDKWRARGFGRRSTRCISRFKEVFKSSEDAADDLEIGKKIFNEQKQVYFELEIPNTLPDLPIHSNTCDLLHTDSIGFITDTNTELIDHSKKFSVSAIEPIGKSCINIDFERKIVQSDDFIELGLNFDLTQFSENFECDCESGSCPICIEINYVLQTDVINCESDDHAAELNENTGADTKEIMINEGEILLQQLAVKRKKKHRAVDDKAILIKHFLLKISLLNQMVEGISLIVQIWQLPP